MSLQQEIACLTKLLPDSVLDVEVPGVTPTEVRDVVASIHRVHSRCLAGRGYDPFSAAGRVVSGLVVGVSVTLRDVANKDARLCPCMFDVKGIRGICGHGSPLFILSQFERAVKNLADVERHSTAKRAVAATYLQDRNNLRDRLCDLVDYDTTGFEAEVVETIAQVVGRMREALTKVNGFLCEDKTREHTLGKVRVGLVGKEAAEGYVFDETPMLIGLRGLSTYCGNAVLRQLVAQFACREGHVVVLAVPHYVEQYLLSVAGLRKSYDITGVVVRESDGPKVLEMAAALWDPESSGGMASLVAALEMARNL